jgi:hypothetical protein
MLDLALCIFLPPLCYGRVCIRAFRAGPQKLKIYPSTNLNTLHTLRVRGSNSCSCYCSTASCPRFIGNHRACLNMYNTKEHHQTPPPHPLPHQEGITALSTLRMEPRDIPSTKHNRGQDSNCKVSCGQGETRCARGGGEKGEGEIETRDNEKTKGTGRTWETSCTNQVMRGTYPRTTGRGRRHKKR